MKIKALQDSYLKKSTEQVSKLSKQSGNILFIPAGKTYEVDSLLAEKDKHYHLRLSHGAGDWWFYSGHFELIEESEQATYSAPLEYKPLISREQLKGCMPHASENNLDTYLEPINKVLVEFEINTPKRIAAFLAQVAHESGSLRYSEEIATGQAYEGREDLGNIFSGDGVKFKGRGLFQLTGRFNYDKYGKLLGINLVDNPEKAKEPYLSARIAGLYWDLNNLNELADKNDLNAITRVINGGLNGWQDRLKYYNLAKRILNSINLPVPHFSQRDNARDPHQTCNVTCVAMVLSYFGIEPINPKIQLEDELDAVVEGNGWNRYLHSDLVKLFKNYGFKSVFSTEVSWEEVKGHLLGGNPVIMSGKFTKSGHIIVLRGFDEKGFYVNDPYGDHMPDGSYRNVSGENLHYSYNKMRQVSYGGDKTTWAHLVSRF